MAAAEAARRSVRDTADLNDTCGVEVPVPGAAARPMVVIKAAKLERARCGRPPPPPPRPPLYPPPAGRAGLI